MKNIFLILSLFYFGLQANAQKFYVNFNTGYALKMGSRVGGGFIEFMNVSYKSNVEYDKLIYYSLGKGIQANISLGYMFNKYIGLDMGLSYIYGSKYKAEWKSDIPLSDYSETYMYGREININPSLILSTDFKKKINFFAKFGVVGAKPVVFIDSKQDEGDYPDPSIRQITIQKFKLNGGLSIGASACAGVKYTASEKLAFTFDISYQVLSYAPKKGKMTEYTIDGKNILPDKTTSDKEFEFVEQINSNDNKDTNKPTKFLKFKYPFGNVGFNLGVMCFF